nr:recombinase family protein [Roseimaritima sediminicola]
MSKRKLIPAVGYARRSTDMQERSIPDQKAYIEKWASENGCKIIRWFIDDALSGTSTRGRDAFADMIDAAENGRDFDVIVCYDIARFSRGGTNETGYYLHRLRMVGVRAVFAADGIPEGDEGELIQGVKSWQARQYSLKLAKDTIRGQISNIRERKSAPGGIAPYGYDKQVVASDGTVLRTLRWMPDGSKQEYDAAGKLLRVIPKGQHIKKAKSDVIRYVPSTPDRVETMRRMFKLCVKGYGFHYIVQLLNKEGVPSPAGQAWNASRIGKLLRNPCYKGAIAWNRHSMGSLFGLDSQGTLRPRTKKDWRKNPTEDWIISEGVHEPLVDVDTWDAAQAEIQKRSRLGGKARPTCRSLLASLIVCKRCGNPIRPSMGPAMGRPERRRHALLPMHGLPSLRQNRLRIGKHQRVQPRRIRFGSDQAGVARRSRNRQASGRCIRRYGSQTQGRRRETEIEQTRTRSTQPQNQIDGCHVIRSRVRRHR